VILIGMTWLSRISRATKSYSGPIEDPHPNIFSEEWQGEMAQGSFGVRGSRLGRQAGATRIGLAVYELDPPLLAEAVVAEGDQDPPGRTRREIDSPAELPYTERPLCGSEDPEDPGRPIDDLNRTFLPPIVLMLYHIVEHCSTL